MVRPRLALSSAPCWEEGGGGVEARGWRGMGGGEEAS